MTEEQLTGILSVAMNGAAGDAMRQWLDRKTRDLEKEMYDDWDGKGTEGSYPGYIIGKGAMLRDIRRGLETMKNAYQALSDRK
jgi:hypothetical protein